MKVTLNWLKQHVEFDWLPEELAERLTMLGIEVEAMHKLAGEFEGIVVAQILASEKHPNADKLSVCRVTDGKGERQIVCGAKNYQVGDKVALILPGHSLPPKPGEQPLMIKVGTRIVGRAYRTSQSAFIRIRSAAARGLALVRAYRPHHRLISGSAATLGANSSRSSSK